MKSFEEIRQANRERILKHICLVAFQREPKPDETNKLNLMLDLGKTISEILSVLRRASSDSNDTSFDIHPISAAVNSHISVNENDNICLRTPLEMHFHRYVSQ